MEERGKHKKQPIYLHKIFERRPKDMWKMSLDDVHIMMFYERPENVI